MPIISFIGGGGGGGGNTFRTAISSESVLISGSRTITDSRILLTSIVYVTPTNVGTLTHPIRVQVLAGSVIFTAQGGTNTSGFLYTIIF